MKAEDDMIYKWVQKNYPGSNIIWHPRLGFYEEEKKIYHQVKDRYPDAVVLTKDKRILIIEGKMRFHVAGIGQLLLYDQLFELTPDFSDIITWPRELILLSNEEDKAVRSMCEKLKIKFVVFK